MLGKALCEEFRLDHASLLELDAITTSIGARPAQFLHDGSSIREGRRFDELETSKAEYASSTVILLVRDPRDTIVSCFFQATKRRKEFEGSLPSFIRDERYGIRKCAAFHRIWAENTNVPKQLILIRYEEMSENPGSVLRMVLAALDMPAVSTASIQNAVSFGDFTNLQTLESTGYFNDRILNPGDATDSESFKVRRGKVGGYRDYLSDADCEYLDRIVAEEGGPLLAPYLPRSLDATE